MIQSASRAPERRRIHKNVLILSSCHLVILSALLIRTPTAPAQEAAPLFDLHTADGLVASGPLVQVDSDWSVSVGGKRTVHAKGSDLVALRQVNSPLPPPPREACIVFTNGDQFPGSPLALRGERVRFKAQAGLEQELTLPLSMISFVWFAAPEATSDSDGLRRRLLSERRKRDTVLLRNGDVVEGTLAGLDAEMICLDNPGGKEAKIARDKVAVLALNTELARSLRPKGIYAKLVLANGGRFCLVSARVDGAALVGKTLFGATVRLPLKDMVAFDFRQGCAVYLSDQNPRRYEHTPYFGVRWPYTRDVSVAGNALHLGGSTYDKGIGMHSQSRLTFDLGGSYRWFEAVVGLDEKTGGEGNVAVQILVDGRPSDLPGAKELTALSTPLRVRVPVTGARELTLVVLFGRHGDVQDHVDWADARLIK
jgi:hypothetical protein